LERNDVKSRKQWTREDYATEIMVLRNQAKRWRQRADSMDATADMLSRETVKFDVMELPNLNPEEKPCQIKP
jgi:hypothetical protein